MKAIIFDVDGVLNKGNEIFSKRFTKEFGVSMEVVLPFFLGPFQECLVGLLDLKEELGKVVHSWGWSGEVDTLLEYWFTGEHNVDYQLVAMIKVLRANGVKCYLATNNEKYRTQYLLEKMQFEGLFDGVFSSAFLGCKKPDPAFYSAVFSVVGKEGVGKSEIMFLDDDLKNVSSASEFGFDARVYSFEEFKELVKNV